jgi:hypothetical protein
VPSTVPTPPASVRLWAPAAALLAAALLASAGLRPRLAWERDRAVELCVDGAELRALSDDDPARAGVLLKRLSDAGVRSLALYAGPESPWRDAAAWWGPVLPADVSLVFRPEGGVRAAPGAWGLAGPLAPRVTAVLPAGPVVPGFPDVSPLASDAAANGWRLPWPEFSRQAGLADLVRRLPDRLVRAHSLDEDEMVKALPDTLRARFRRAVRERGVRFLYLRFFPGLDDARNVAFIESLAASLRRDGFVLEPASPRRAAWPGGAPPVPQAARRLLAFLAAVLLPLWAFRAALRVRGPATAFLVMNLLTLASALLVAACLSTPDFALGLDRFRGVKAALALPPLVAVFLLYRPAELRSFARRPLTLGLAAVLLLVAGAAAVYLLRSGHDALEVSGGERRMREALEAAFGVRPRFKEFLIGHPLLCLGLYLRRRGPAGWDARPALLAGFLGQLSIVNTFCHAHTPLGVSLLRTWHGWWVGLLLGLALIALARAAARRGLARSLPPSDAT